MLSIVIDPIVLIALHWAIGIAVSLRILLTRRSHGSSLAWITLTLALPYVGASLYLLIGEVWFSRQRSKQIAEIIQSEFVAQPLVPKPFPSIPGVDAGLVRILSSQAASASSSAITESNRLELLEGADASFQSIIADIEEACESCFVLTYIWHTEGKTDTITHALVRAAARGVDCRVLVDSHGSARFLKGSTRRRLESAGVRVAAANRAGWLRLRLARLDLRNHRKIVTVDGQIGYTGSLNIVDPACFKLHAGVGRWIDCVVRVAGPAAQELQSVFLRDWRTEHPEPRTLVPVVKTATRNQTEGGFAQVLPSGPGQDPIVLRQMLLRLIYAARFRLIITTPYFVPDEAMLTAVMSAARGGVTVQLVIPKKSDIILAAMASQSYFGELLASGVEIHRFSSGLLHSKTVMVDGSIAMIGSANMDLRSFELNLEISIILYDQQFSAKLLRLQESYLAQSCRIDSSQWVRRLSIQRVLDNAAQLIAPIL